MVEEGMGEVCGWGEGVGEVWLGRRVVRGM